MGVSLKYGDIPDFLRIQVVYEEVLVKDSFVGWPYPRMLSIELQDTGAPPGHLYGWFAAFAAW